MIDQIYARNGSDVPLERALITSMGAANGTGTIDAILANNPIWTRSTPRFKIWTDIARLAARRNILIHPDARVGKAGDCCSHIDGNAWFEDAYLPVSNWTRGLAYVANWARNHTNIVSMSLLSSPRESSLRPDLEYNWHTFVGNMTLGASAVHSANSDLLITWPGLQFGEDLSALTTGKNLLTAPCYRCSAIRDALRRPAEAFSLSSLPFSDRVVYELHLLSSTENLDTGSCRVLQAQLYRNGFSALGIPRPAGCNITADCPPATTLTPVMLSDFSHVQDLSLKTATLSSCLRDFTTRNNVSWATWSLAGKWRGQPGEDTTGLLNASWTGWRYPEGVETWWKPWVAAMGVSKP
jgi:endoglucanase